MEASIAISVAVRRSKDNDLQRNEREGTIGSKLIRIVQRRQNSASTPRVRLTTSRVSWSGAPKMLESSLIVFEKLESMGSMPQAWNWMTRRTSLWTSAPQNAHPNSIQHRVPTLQSMGQNEWAFRKRNITENRQGLKVRVSKTYFTKKTRRVSQLLILHLVRFFWAS